MEEPFGFGGDVEVEGAHQRTAPRDSLFLQAQLQRPGREPVTLRIRNLSAGGLMADCAEPLYRGEAIEMEIRGLGLVGGTVAWIHNGRIGMAFYEPVDPKLARKPVVGGTPKSTVLLKVDANPRRPGLRID